MNEHQHQQAEYEEEINLLQLLQVIVRRKHIIMYCCAVAIVFSVCYSLTLKNVYTATAKLLPPQKESSGGLSALLTQAGGLAGLAAGGLGGSADLYIGIFKSRSVGDAVVKRLDLQKEFKTKTLEDARRTLEGVVKIQAAKDGIITISADSIDPKKAALLANTFVDELSRRSVQLNLTKVGTERIFLEKRLEVVKRDLQNAENDMKAFQEKYKTIKADSQAAAAIEGIAKLKAELASKEVQLATLRNSMTDENSEVKAVKAAIGNIRSQLTAMSGSGGVDVIPSMGNAPGLGLDYVRKLRELKTQEAIFEQLSRQYEVAKLNEAKDSSSLQVLDEAVPPLKKSKPRRSVIVILSTISALFISIFIIFIQDYFSKLPPDDALLLGEIKRSLFRLRREGA